MDGRVYYNEIDPFAVAWLAELMRDGLIPRGEIDTRSIRDVHPGDLTGFVQCHFFAGIAGWAYALELAGWPSDRPVWTGSCPCQPFSAAGKRKGVEDERHLWPEFRRLITECNPPTVFGEQVASKDGRIWLAGVRADLEALGYAVGAADLCAAGIGAPHIRQRLFWVAHAVSAGRPEWRSISRQRSIAGSGSVRRLADANEGQRGRLTAGEGRKLNRQTAGWEQGDSLVESSRSNCWLADADGGLAGDGELQPRWQHGQQPENGFTGDGLADAERNPGDARRFTNQPAEGLGTSSAGSRPELGRCGVPGGLHDTSSPRQQPAWQEPEGEARDEARLRGFERRCHQGWGSTWIDCADGKARRVEPSIQPLAHGVPNRVGTLRGAGNAIVPQVAAEVIAAIIDTEFAEG